MKLKICGIKSVQEAVDLADLGVDLIGLNFIPSSTRCIDLRTAADISDRIAGLPIQTVALFQDQPLDLVLECVQKLKPDLVQLHGSEDNGYISKISCPVIKSLAVSSLDNAQKIINNAKAIRADYYLLDRASRGSGPVIDGALAFQVCSDLPDRIFLSGGITPQNLASILDQSNPYGLDIASGVRTNDQLDILKVKAVLEVLRSRNDT